MSGTAPSVYDFAATSIDGVAVPLNIFRDHVLLVVNVASRCGFTPQYRGLESLFRRYSDRGFTVLGFPCDQFGGQEPASDAEIARFCADSFGVTFPLFRKVEVNGPRAHPLFTFLTRRQRGWLGPSIKWNFTKFLVDRSGQPIARYGSRVRPSSLEGPILRAMDS